MAGKPEKGFMIYLCLGRREQGKTTLALYLTRTHRARVLFDPRGLIPAPVRVTRLSEIQPAFDNLWTDVKEGPQTIVLTPDGRVQPFFERTAEEVKRWVREPHAPSIAFLVDELRFVDPNTEAFDWLCRCATRAQVTIVATAHRPTDVPTDLRAITDVWCLFQATQEHDLQVIETRCSAATRADVQRLKPREFIVWDDTRGVRTAYLDPRVWYSPLLHTSAPVIDESLPPANPIDSDKLFE